MIPTGLCALSAPQFLYDAAWCWLFAVYLTQELLTQYGVRLPARAWRAFARRHRWRLLGFGLPVWLAFRARPLWAIAALDALQASAAVLLARCLRAEERRAAAAKAA